jgi:hypothetical protein
MYVCIMFVCTFLRMYYVCMYVCMYVCTYLRMYVCMYVFFKFNLLHVSLLELMLHALIHIYSYNTKLSSSYMYC